MFGATYRNPGNKEGTRLLWLEGESAEAKVFRVAQKKKKRRRGRKKKKKAKSDWTRVRVKNWVECGMEKPNTGVFRKKRKSTRPAPNRELRRKKRLTSAQPKGRAREIDRGKKR